MDVQRVQFGESVMFLIDCNLAELRTIYRGIAFLEGTDSVIEMQKVILRMLTLAERGLGLVNRTENTVVPTWRNNER